MQRDDRGYGMEVAGSAPVYVSSVKPGEVVVWRLWWLWWWHKLSDQIMMMGRMCLFFICLISNIFCSYQSKHPKHHKLT